MENRCITKVKSQVDIENIIYPYNNNTEDVFIDLGHYDNDNNVRVSDIIIKFNGTVSLNNQQCLLTHEFGNNRGDVYNWYMNIMCMLDMILPDDNVDKLYKDAVLYNVKTGFRDMCQQSLIFEYNPIQKGESPVVNALVEDVFIFKFKHGLSGYRSLVEIEIEGGTFYIMGNGIAMVDKPCTLSLKGFKTLLSYGATIYGII